MEDPPAGLGAVGYREELPSGGHCSEQPWSFGIGCLMNTVAKAKFISDTREKAASTSEAVMVSDGHPRSCKSSQEAVLRTGGAASLLSAIGRQTLAPSCSPWRAASGRKERWSHLCPASSPASSNSGI